MGVVEVNAIVWSVHFRLSFSICASFNGIKAGFCVPPKYIYNFLLELHSRFLWRIESWLAYWHEISY